jgi:predicted dinucleotide-utilizing enzyme
MHVSIGLIGFGAVGKAFAELTEQIVERDNFRIHAILVRDIANKKFSDVEITNQADWFVPSNGHNIIVDASSYNEETKGYILASLLDGKDLITCSKELVNKNWRELLDAAKVGGSKIYFNSIPSTDDISCKFNEIDLTSDNFEQYADDDLYIYRGGDAEITATFLYNDVVRLLQERIERHESWESSQ